MLRENITWPHLNLLIVVLSVPIYKFMTGVILNNISYKLMSHIITTFLPILFLSFILYTNTNIHSNIHRHVVLNLYAQQVEVIHFAAHISWKLSSIVLSPGEFASNMSSQHFPLTDSEDGTSDVSTLGCPSLSEYLLTAADILNLKLHAKLVVLNSGYTDDRAGRVNTDGVVGLTRALLSAGAHCVLFSLWPVPDSASKLLMRTLYGTLIDGYRITQVRIISISLFTIAFFNISLTYYM